MDYEVQVIKDELKFITTIYKKVLDFLPSFYITDSSILPYGLKPHARSVAWLAEQVIIQQSKKHMKHLGLKEVFFDLEQTSLHDCQINTYEAKYYINIKIHNIKKKENKNDIAQAEKLYLKYKQELDYRLIYVCFGIDFEGIKISFNKNYLHVFSPQFLPIYINPRTNKLQATYHHKVTLRTRLEFLELLR